MAGDVIAVWMAGVPVPAGRLVRLIHGDTAFVYEADYAARDGLPLSLSLPLDGEAYGDVETRAFFGNLLPENAQLQRIMERHGLARDDIVGLLRHLGADCAGSVSCLPTDAPPVKSPGVLSEDYELLDDRAVLRIARSLREERRLPIEVTDPSPVRASGARSPSRFSQTVPSPCRERDRGRPRPTFSRSPRAGIIATSGMRRPPPSSPSPPASTTASQRRSGSGMLRPC